MSLSLERLSFFECFLPGLSPFIAYRTMNEDHSCGGHHATPYTRNRCIHLLHNEGTYAKVELPVHTPIYRNRCTEHPRNARISPVRRLSVARSSGTSFRGYLQRTDVYSNPTIDRGSVTLSILTGHHRSLTHTISSTNTGVRHTALENGKFDFFGIVSETIHH